MTRVMKQRAREGNAEAIEAWNGVLYEKFHRHRRSFVAGLEPFGTAALTRHPPPRGARVLDIGCGFGETTVEIARRVGADGEAIGVDVAARFLGTAAREARARGLSNVRFFAADVQHDRLHGPYAHAFSRFGTMFFAQPVIALRNVRSALVAGAKLCMVVWRDKHNQAVAYDIERAVLEMVSLPAVTDEPTCGPGPFSMAAPDVVSSQLQAAGFTHVTFERFDTSMYVGASLDEAVAVMMDIGPAGEVLRVAAAANRHDGEVRRREAEVAAVVKTILAPYCRSDGVFVPASTWIISGTAE